jgi:hypothetical protein
LPIMMTYVQLLNRTFLWIHAQYESLLVEQKKKEVIDHLGYKE